MTPRQVLKIFVRRGLVFYWLGEKEGQPKLPVKTGWKLNVAEGFD